jgi:hypothetical protein
MVRNNDDSSINDFRSGENITSIKTEKKWSGKYANKLL